METILIHKSGRKPYTLPNDTKIDWEQPNGQIAKQIGTTILTVMKLRARLGIAPLPRGRPTESRQACQLQLQLFPPQNEVNIEKEITLELQEKILELIKLLE